MQKRLSGQGYVEGILSGNRVILSRAITLIESQLSQDKILASQVLESILPFSGKAIRIGITGVPGVGKSTFIEAFGKFLTSQGKKVAVLAIDPSSQKSKGSILGDKTRMEQLAHDPLAYIRPSPAGAFLGGVANRTRETMLICEAAGFDVIIIETVGVGQSETFVRGMVDFFLLLMLAGAGDELQGLKKGIMEMADTIAITKADSDNLPKAKLARAEYENAIHLFPPEESGWYARVMTCSALENAGIAEIWDLVEQHKQLLQKNGFFEKNRQNQNLEWMQNSIQQTLGEHFYNHPKVQERLKNLQKDVISGKILPHHAAFELLSIYIK